MQLAHRRAEQASETAEAPAVVAAPAEGSATADPAQGAVPVPYTELLGTYLGAELHRAVAGQLTQEKLSGAASAALDAAFEKLSAIQAPNGVASDVIPALVGLLQAEVDTRADAWLEENGAGVTSALRGWVDASPRTVVAVALTAAVAAVLADVDLPTLQRKFKVGGSTTLDVSAQLGSIRNIALQELRVALEGKSGALVLAHDDGATTVEGRLGDEKRQVSATGRVEGSDFVIEGVRGLWTSSDGNRTVEGSANRSGEVYSGAVSLTDVAGERRTVTSVRYDPTVEGITLGRAMTEGTSSQSTSLTRDQTGTTLSGAWSDGSWSAQGSSGPNGTTLGGSYRDGPWALHGDLGVNSARLGGSYTSERLTASGALSTGENGARAELGLAWRREDLLAELQTSLAERGASTLSGRVQSGRHSFGGDAGFSLDEGVLNEVGMRYGFEDPNSFRRFVLEARRNFDVDETTFSLLAQDKIQEIYWRLQASGSVRENRFGYDATAQAARYVNSDTALILGIRGQRDNVAGTSTVSPQLGVQYKGVPVVVEYDPSTKRVGVSLGIRF